MAKYLNLQEVYNRGRLHFSCNRVGETFDADMVPVEPEELPTVLMNLFNFFWTDSHAAGFYVATLDNMPGMLINYVFDEEMLNDALGADDIPNTDGAKLNAFQEAVRECAESLAEHLHKEATVLFGANTDPAGHEISIFYPFNKCFRNFPSFYKELGDKPFDMAREILNEKFESLYGKASAACHESCVCDLCAHKEVCALKGDPNKIACEYFLEPIVEAKWDKNGHCTNCGGADDVSANVFYTKQCPHCGAKMSPFAEENEKEEKNDED